jgi:hypothetical protein
MRIFFYLLFFLLPAVQGWSQSFGVIYAYEGTVATSAVYANIRWIDSTVSGVYYYRQSGEPLYLTGTVNQGRVTLSELVNDSITGNFSGTVNNERTELSGTWSNQKKSFPFRLKLSRSEGAAQLGVVARSFSETVWQTSSGIKIGPSFTGCYCYVKKNADAAAMHSINGTLIGLGERRAEGEEALRQAVQQTLQEDFEFFKSDYDTAFPVLSEEEKKWMEESPYSFQWEQQINWEVLLNENYLLGVRALFYQYTGGAHGNFGFSNVNFDLRTGRQLTLEGLLKPGFEQELTGLLLQELMRQYRAPGLDELSEQGFFLEEGLPLNGNFFLQKNGIGFTYNPYEIAAYALGSIDILIPWKSLQPLIPGDSPLRRLADP